MNNMLKRIHMMEINENVFGILIAGLEEVEGK